MNQTAVWVLLHPTRFRAVQELWDGPTVFRTYPRRLECLTICRCHNRGSTFSSVILRPWVMVWPGFEPVTSHSSDRHLSNLAKQFYWLQKKNLQKISNFHLCKIMRNKSYLCKSSTKEVYSHTCNRCCSMIRGKAYLSGLLLLSNLLSGEKVAESWERWTCNSVAPSSSPTLTTSWICLQ